VSLAKTEIRRSLSASTIDGVFASMFSNVTCGALLSNFLVDLQATPLQIGMVASIPMLANFVQPLGAWLSDRFPSRHNFCASVYFPARLVWLLLLVGMLLFGAGRLEAEVMVIWTMAVMFVSFVLGGLGGPAWLSWMAALVPRRLRGRYFSLRNSAANLTGLIVIPLSGLFVGWYPLGELAGFEIMLGLAIVAGIISLLFQWRMADVPPLEAARSVLPLAPTETQLAETQLAETEAVPEMPASFWSILFADRNFLCFLLYFSGLMFSLNLSAPFFNLYLLQDLAIDVSWVTVYASLASGANLLLLLPFGRLSDRLGNRLPLLLAGFLMALLPMLWLVSGTGRFSLWLWLPLLHMLNGGASAALDLCNNNLQLGLATGQHQAKFFGVIAAIAGVSGALGTLIGGSLTQWADIGGLTGLFLLSGVVRFLALLPLFWIQEERGWKLPDWLKGLRREAAIEP
jgi:MFS family permease